MVQSGKKKFEFRVADFDIKEGDTLILQEWDSKAKKYTGHKTVKKVGYTAKFNLDSFNQRELLEKHGLYVIQLV